MSPPRISINFYEIEILPIGPGISNGQRMFVPAERLGPVCRSAFTFEANGARLPPMGFLFSCFFFSFFVFLHHLRRGFLCYHCRRILRCIRGYRIASGGKLLAQCLTTQLAGNVPTCSDCHDVKLRRAVNGTRGSSHGPALATNGERHLIPLK